MYNNVYNIRRKYFLAMYNRMEIEEGKIVDGMAEYFQ